MHILHLKNTKLLHSQAGRFLLVGGATVLVDFVVYVLLLFVGIETDMAKGISFSMGAVFAYFANKGYTFNSQKKGLYRFMLFSVLYGLTLVVNISANELVLFLLDKTQLFIVFAFLVATIVSAILNYLGMKYIIFKN